MLGYAVAELRNKTTRDITHPDDHDAVLTGRRQLLAGEISSHTMEKRYLRKDQSIFWASMYRSLVRDQENRPKYFIVVVEDINERKQAEAALRESEERLKSAERLAHIGHWHWDLKSDQLILSEECLRIFGRPRDYTPSKEAFF
jgi:PAS domain S-box-containing protein